MIYSTQQTLALAAMHVARASQQVERAKEVLARRGVGLESQAELSELEAALDAEATNLYQSAGLKVRKRGG